MKADPPALHLARELDDADLRRAGLRKLSGRHITLITDLPASAEVDALPAEFDQAYPQWCDYFATPDQQGRPWRVNAFLMVDQQRFRAAGVMPDDLPPFQHGFAQGLDLWLNEQPSPYYRRHLLLHEGTHAFMFSVLGNCGPQWFMEGMAELLATHRLVDGRLTLNSFPQRREDVPLLGRIKLVQEAVAAGRLLSVTNILALSTGLQRDNEMYAWCWALTAFLDGSPKYRERFRGLRSDVARSDFNRLFRERFARDWRELNDEWQLFASSLEHAHDLSRSAIEFLPGEPLPAKGAKVTIAADRGWQSSGLRLEAGRTYRLRATGRYQVAAPGSPPRIWWSEPGGVSIRYYAGHPLGLLLAAVRPDAEETETAPSSLLKPTVVGLETTWRPDVSGTLYLRINDSAAELADNVGQVEVSIEPSTAATSTKTGKDAP